MAFSAAARQAGQAWRAPADAWGKAVWNRQPLSRLEGHSALRTVQKSVREEPSRAMAGKTAWRWTGAGPAFPWRRLA